jgi:hypothetical protein
MHNSISTPIHFIGKYGRHSPPTPIAIIFKPFNTSLTNNSATITTPSLVVLAPSVLTTTQSSYGDFQPMCWRILYHNMRVVGTVKASIMCFLVTPLPNRVTSNNPKTRPIIYTNTTDGSELKNNSHEC